MFDPDKIEKIANQVEQALRQSVDLQERIKEINDRYVCPSEDDDSIATIPFLFSEIIRAILEDSRKWWMRNCAILLACWGLTLLALVGVIIS